MKLTKWIDGILVLAAVPMVGILLAGIYLSHFSDNSKLNELNRKVRKGNKYYKELNCASCHGKPGEKPLIDTYPVIFGQNAPYLVNQLKSFRAGRRTNDSAALMQAQVLDLKDREIEAIALYLQSKRE